MKIFIRGVPAGVTEWHLRQFVTKAFGYRRFIPIGVTPKMTSCSIMRIKDEEFGHIEFHGVVTVAPEDAARRVVQKLHRTRLRGKLVEVRTFYDRARINERRINQIDRREQIRDPSSRFANTRRLRDRRRNRLVVAVVSCPASAGAIELYKSFGNL